MLFLVSIVNSESMRNDRFPKIPSTSCFSTHHEVTPNQSSLGAWLGFNPFGTIYSWSIIFFSFDMKLFVFLILQQRWWPDRLSETSLSIRAISSSNSTTQHMMSPTIVNPSLPFPPHQVVISIIMATQEHRPSYPAPNPWASHSLLPQVHSPVSQPS